MCIAIPAVADSIAMAIAGPLGQATPQALSVANILGGGAAAAQAVRGSVTPGFPSMAGSFQCYGTSAITDNAWSTATKIANLGIATAVAAMQDRLGWMKLDLGQQWYEMARSKWDRFQQRYIPSELKMIQEVSVVQVKTLDCPGAKNRARTSVNTAYDAIGAYMARQAKVMRLCLDSSCTTLVDQKRAVTAIDTENYNLGDEQWYTDYKNDQRWNRRSTILNLGRNLATQSLQYGQVALSTMDRVGEQVNRAGTAASTALGYTGARNDTYWPQSFLRNGASDVIAGQAVGGGTGQNTTGTSTGHTYDGRNSPDD